MTSLFALGWTQHSVGAQNIRTMAMIQLLLGNIGVAGGGMNALRGHSNIQGLTDVGLLSDAMPGYLTLPKDSEPTFAEYMKTRQFKPLRPGQTSYWQNYNKFVISLQKTLYGDAAQAANDWAYDWLPKLDVPLYDIIRAFEMMDKGEMNGYICQGFNPLQAFPDKGKIRSALGKLKFLVTMDPLDTETSRFWENFGPQNPSDPAKIQTEVFQLPTTCFAEEKGSLVNSARWLQWHWKAANPPGDAQSDIFIVSGIFHRLREMYRKEGGAFPDPLLNLTWDYTNPVDPDPEDLAKEMNGRALTDIKDPTTGAVTLHAGQLLDGFAQLRDDGTTASGCWIFSGCYTERGNMMARRDATDPREQGIAPNWAWAWPANRRILYNRASADPSGKPWNPVKPVIEWGRQPLGRYRHARLHAHDQALRLRRSLHHERGGRRAAVRAQLDGRRALSRALRAARVAVGEPAAPGRQFESCSARLRRRPRRLRDFEGLPVRGHHLSTDRALSLLDQACPDQLHSAARGVRGDRRGARPGEGHRSRGLGAGLLETRHRGLQGLRHQANQAAPRRRPPDARHRCSPALGFTGQARKGYGANTLTPSVGDANTQTPEFKAFLVNVEKTSRPAS